MDVSRETVTDVARRVGFVLVGFSRVRRLDDREPSYRAWLDAGGHATMDYLAEDATVRIDPRLLDARYRSVVSLGFPYAPPAIPRVDWRAEMRGRIAAYALGRDYHDVVKKRARIVADTITSARRNAVARAYVDTGPVLEREWGADSRIGWFGKNTMILNREHGSYFFLAEIFTDAEFDADAEPYREHCGSCRRCLDLCPTGALRDGYVMDSRLCISYQTIENRGPIPRELRPKLGNWIFGCDICNEVCPWNGDDTAASRRSSNGSWALVPFLPYLLSIDDDAFSRAFIRSTMKRAKRRGLLRNAAVVLGNTRNPGAIPALERSIESEHEPLIRSHVAWALGQIGGVDARRILERARMRDPDQSVREEICAALETI